MFQSCLRKSPCNNWLLVVSSNQLCTTHNCTSMSCLIFTSMATTLFDLVHHYIYNTGPHAPKKPLIRHVRLLPKVERDSHVPGAATWRWLLSPSSRNCSELVLPEPTHNQLRFSPPSPEFNLHFIHFLSTCIILTSLFFPPSLRSVKTPILNTIKLGIHIHMKITNEEFRTRFRSSG